MEPTSSSSWSSDSLIQTLITRGWCFQNIDQIKYLITIQTALHGDSCTIESIESELCNMDLRSVGAKSLPDTATLRKSSHFNGPKVLQISSARDITKSSIVESSGNSSDRRMLRLKLTDGHSEIIAVEFSRVSAIPDNVVPGTKICLLNNAVIHSGIVCLNPKVVSVLGGVVQSLHDEWEMNQKYSGFFRSSLKSSQNDESGGPPPFEKLQVGAYRSTQQSRTSHHSKSTVKGSEPSSEKGGSHGSSQTSESSGGLKVNSRDQSKPASLIEKTEEKQPSSEARPKEVAESVPVQNQAAAQKLFQKMNNHNRDDRRSRGWKQRVTEQDDRAVLTLDEYERRRAGGSSSVRQELPNISQDEELARQLQNQFDLEDRHEQRGAQVTEADNIRMNMFTFEREDSEAHGRSGFRGRGRGRSRGRGRGRGRFG